MSAYPTSTNPACPCVSWASTNKPSSPTSSAPTSPPPSSYPTHSASSNTSNSDAESTTEHEFPRRQDGAFARDGSTHHHQRGIPQRRPHRGTTHQPQHLGREKPRHHDENPAADAGHLVALAAQGAALGRSDRRNLPGEPTPRLRNRYRQGELLRHQRPDPHCPADVGGTARPTRARQQPHPPGNTRHPLHPTHPPTRRHHRRTQHPRQPTHPHRPRQNQHHPPRQIRRHHHPGHPRRRRPPRPQHPHPTRHHLAPHHQSPHPHHHPQPHPPHPHPRRRPLQPTPQPNRTTTQTHHPRPPRTTRTRTHQQHQLRPTPQRRPHPTHPHPHRPTHPRRPRRTDQSPQEDAGDPGSSPGHRRVRPRMQFPGFLSGGRTVRRPHGAGVARHSVAAVQQTADHRAGHDVDHRHADRRGQPRCDRPAPCRPTRRV